MGSFSLTLLPNFFDLTSVTKFLLFDRIYGRNLMKSETYFEQKYIQT